MYYTSFESDLCEFVLIGDEEGLKRLHMNVHDSNRHLEIDDSWIRNDDFFKSIKDQLLAYVRGDLEDFHAKLNPDGTDFQKKVWQALSEIPYGQTRSYKEIAKIIGNENASRAVGMANGKNPIPVIVPCHRVIGSNGKLTGFAFGTRVKDDMLKIEKRGKNADNK